MNKQKLKSGLVRIVVASFCLALGADAARAATGTWTGEAEAEWGTTYDNWSGVTGTPWDLANGTNNAAVFNTAGATPSVSGTVYVNAITFDNTATVGGGTIALGRKGATQPSITANSDVTINASLTNTATTTPLTKNGAGTLVLAGNSTFSSMALSVSQGKLVMTAANTLGRQVSVSSGAELVVTNGATLTTSTGQSAVAGTLRVNGGTFSDGYDLVIQAGGRTIIESGIYTNARQIGIAGTMLVNGGTFAYKYNAFHIGWDLAVPDNSSGIMIQSNGLFSAIGAPNSYNLYIGSSPRFDSPSSGAYTMVGGTQTVDRGVVIGNANGTGTSVGTLTISNAVGVTEPVANIPSLVFGVGANAQGTLNLAAGTLRVNSLSNGGVSTYTQVFNFSGGTLRPYNNTATIGSTTAANNTTITLIGTDATISSSDKDGFGRTVNIRSKLTGEGAITFTGTGTHNVMSPDNAYTGHTTVNGATVVWSYARLSANADLICINSPTINLAYTGTNTIRRLYVNGTAQTPAVYKAANAPADMTITGAGALEVTEAEPSKGTVISIR